MFSSSLIIMMICSVHLIYQLANLEWLLSEHILYLLLKVHNAISQQIDNKMLTNQKIIYYNFK